MFALCLLKLRRSNTKWGKQRLLLPSFCPLLHSSLFAHFSTESVTTKFQSFFIIVVVVVVLLVDVGVFVVILLLLLLLLDRENFLYYYYYYYWC